MDDRVLLSRLDRYVEQKMQAGDIPGLALALTDREQTLHVATYGFADVAARAPVTPDTLFEIGSISKSFTSIALLQLWEEGRLDLDAPVSRYLPWFQVRSCYEPITLHHLLSHTAGIITGTEFTAEGRYAVWALRNTEAGAPPGVYFHYSNDGYKTLGLVLEEVLGQPCGQVVQQRLLDPLGMASTEPVITHSTRCRLAVGYEPFYDDRPLARGGALAPATWLETATGDGSIASTPADMAVYLRMLLNRGRGPRGRLLSEAGFALLTQPAIAMAEEGEERDTFYGYGLDVRCCDGRTVIGHGGGMVGYRAHVLADLTDGLGAVALINGPGEPKEVAQFALTLLSAARRGRELPPLPPLDPQRVERAAEYTGLYCGAAGSLRLVAEGERLFLEHGSERVPLELRGTDRFYADHPAWARFLLRCGRQEGRVVEVFHGPDWYAGERYTGPTAFEHPPQWAAYTGHYRSYNPWYSNFRILLRKGALVLVEPWGEEEPLTALEDGSFRVGADERSPERLRFDTVVNGQAVHANLSGGDYYRTFTP
mgnify:CR=1 FL=1